METLERNGPLQRFGFCWSFPPFLCFCGRGQGSKVSSRWLCLTLTNGRSSSLISGTTTSISTQPSPTWFQMIRFQDYFHLIPMDPIGSQPIGSHFWLIHFQWDWLLGIKWIRWLDRSFCLPMLLDPIPIIPIPSDPVPMDPMPSDPNLVRP